MRFSMRRCARRFFGGASQQRNGSQVRHRALTDEGAIAGIDQACKRLRLRLPTIRHNVADTIAAATSGQWSYHGLLAELLLAECDDRDRRSVVRRVKSARFPRQSGWPTSISTPTPTRARFADATTRRSSSPFGKYENRHAPPVERT